MKRSRFSEEQIIGILREAEAGREKVFDPIFSKDSRSADDALVATRSYRPAHSVGHLRYLECSELAENGRPAGDLTPWGEIFFAYDPAFEKVSDYSELPVDKALAHSLARLGLGVDIALHGFVRLPDLSGFAAGMQKQFAETFLPGSLV